MVCEICRRAAAVARETEVIYQYLDARPQEMIPGYTAAAKIHQDCHGGTWCDCQHVIPGIS